MSQPEPLSSALRDLLKDPRFVKVGQVMADGVIPPAIIDIPKSDSLRGIMRRQYDFQMSLGHYPPSMSDEDLANYIQVQTLACLDELHEALAEVGWKPWAKSRHLNRDAFVGELIDAFHFLLNLFMAADVDTRELVEKFHAKNDVNWQRQRDNYDGVSTKCEMCRRALDEPGKESHQVKNSQGKLFCNPECLAIHASKEETA